MGYKDETRNPISGKYGKCVFATDNPFWKRAEDIQNKIETRSMLRKKKKCYWRIMQSYYNNLPRLSTVNTQ